MSTWSDAGAAPSATSTMPSPLQSPSRCVLSPAAAMAGHHEYSGVSGADLDTRTTRAGATLLPDGHLVWKAKTIKVPARLPVDFMSTRFPEDNLTNFRRALLDALRKMKQEQYKLCQQDSSFWEKNAREKHPEVLVFHKEFIVETGSIEHLTLDGRNSAFPYEVGLLTAEDEELLDSFFNLRSIRMLYCGLASFENLPRLRFLRELDLSGNRIGSFKGLLCFRYLKTLNLWSNQIVSLKHFPFSPALEELNLTGNPLDASLARLVERAGNLRVLRLGHTCVSDPDHLLPLAKLPKLQLIDISGTPLAADRQKLARLGTLLPKLCY
ncbi:leucine rich repeat-containing protein [Cystoisospora suis]|uniref:Leucine rich repeat-containing protein n=1 Tax=Cystoisospora suis TaxID=483139 RepID=A0A2C6KIH6_9APIC|nr:leucine rich repeat-containing protein [Cystoisospora suis]